MFLDGGDAFESVIDLFAIAKDVLDLLLQVVELGADAVQFTVDIVEAPVMTSEARIDPIESLIVLVQVFVHAHELIQHQSAYTLKIGLRHMLQYSTQVVFFASPNATERVV